MFGRGLLLLLILSLAGCGFQLRGSVPILPPIMERTYVQSASNTALYRELQGAIRTAGGTLVEHPSAASAVLILHGERFSRRNLGTDARGRTNAYEHRLQVLYSLQDGEGQTLVSRERVDLFREQRFDPEQVLSMEDEQDILRQEMRNQAINQMLRRLQALGRQAP